MRKVAMTCNKHFAICCMMLLPVAAMAQIFSGETVKTPADSVDVRYYSVPEVVPEQSQLVYSYPRGNNSQPVNIYIDKEFHTALQPGEFTTLCINAGLHTLVEAVNDAPFYKEKSVPKTQTEFDSGKTYFFRITDKGMTSKVATRLEAEKELQEMKRQVRLVNRASSVQPCRYINQGKGYLLAQESIFFRFGGSDSAAILPESRNKINEIISAAKQSKNIERIELTGFTDGIGNKRSNASLSAARAETVKHIFIEEGFPAEVIYANGGGVAASAEGCGKNAGEKQKGCNKTSRRVEVTIKGH